MMKCWDYDPKKRPNFDECMKYLEKILSENDEKETHREPTTNDGYLPVISDDAYSSNSNNDANTSKKSQYINLTATQSENAREGNAYLEMSGNRNSENDAT